MTLSIIDNVGGIIYFMSLLWFINKLKGVPLWKLYVFANLTKLINVLQVAVFLDSPVWLLISARFVIGIIHKLTYDLFELPMIGRISKLLPEGYESTGVVVITSCLSLSATLSQKLGAS